MLAWQILYPLNHFPVLIEVLAESLFLLLTLPVPLLYPQPLLLSPITTLLLSCNMYFITPLETSSSHFMIYSLALSHPHIITHIITIKI